MTTQAADTSPDSPGVPVVVTTEHRGVFFGYQSAPMDPATRAIEISQAQMCVYWSSDVQGVLGLAATGPTKGCKVTRPVPRISLSGVTAVIEATDEAVTSWQGRPWS